MGKTCRIAALMILVLGISLPSFGAQGSGVGNPIKVGNLITLTGPNSSPGIGIQRGMTLAVEEINKAGGIQGRKIELISRDTQGDPTKAVNAALELINNEKVEFIVGPTNSGEGMATTSLISRHKQVLSIVIGAADELIDAEKYPYAFRIFPSNSQWIGAANDYLVNILKAKKIGLLGDTTGYGTASVNLAERMLKERGIDVVYRGLVEPTQADVLADVRKARSSGAEAMDVWTNATGLIARFLNGRAELGWSAPFAGHPSLAHAQTKALLAKPDNWKDVYQVGYRSMSYDEAGTLPESTQKLLTLLREAGAPIGDTPLFFIASGYDTVHLIRYGMEGAGSSKADDVRRFLNSGKTFPGTWCRCTYSPTNHNGFATANVVMNRADSFRSDGTYALAPGYGK